MILEQFSDIDSILDSVLTHILLLDKNLNIIYANSAAQQLFAQGPQKLYSDYSPNLLNYFSLNIDLMNTALSQGQGFTDNEVNLVVNGQLHIFSLTAQQFNQQRILIEMTPLNIHKRLSSEQQQQAQQDAAKDLVRGLAHEIKNPLGGIRGAAQLLAKELPRNELQDYTQLIIEQADRLRNLVDRLLGPQNLPHHKLQNVHQAIERIYQLLSLEKSDNITITRDYDPSLPELTHDADQLEQVILNIARNALQALDQQGDTILIRTRTASQVTIKGKSCRLCIQIDIEDNGPGVPLNLQDTLFYPLVSGHEKGSGLGLSIARNIIDQHQGKIEFKSWPGHTKFSIYLPIRY